MKRIFFYTIIISVPALVFLNVWQAYTYQEIKREVSDLEGKQMSLFEENKQRIIGIEYLRSPARIGQLAEEKLGLIRRGASAIIRIGHPNRTEESAGRREGNSRVNGGADG